VEICGNIWAIVLAGGDGRRLQSLTTTRSGIAIPKQFCSLRGGRSLLHEALQRAAAIAVPKRICVVVADAHQRWWTAALEALPTSNVISQPSNRGTAIGILLALAHVIAKDPDARVVLLPSDHHVDDEDALAKALRRGVRALNMRPEQILLLGIRPGEPDPGLGYIVPQAVDGAGIWTVQRFVEKPSAPVAGDLIAAGALWNTFIVAAHAQSLLALFKRRIPAALARIQALVERRALAADVYRELPNVDFSHEILPGAESMLRVLPVRSCGWSDIGTPQRVIEALRRSPQHVDPVDGFTIPQTGLLNLESQHARLVLKEPASMR
jgi:mannose-1-phosphate guanylyltransferase